MDAKDAIEILQEEYDWGQELSYVKKALEMAISALTPVSKEQVKKAWEGCSWCENEGKNPENWDCSLLDERGFPVMVGDEVIWTNAEFCPVCGKPLTEDALEELVKKLQEVIEWRGVDDKT